MPLVARTSAFPVRGVRIYFDDLVKIHSVLSGHGVAPARVAVDLQDPPRTVTLASLDELKSWPVQIVSRIEIGGTPRVLIDCESGTLWFSVMSPDGMEIKRVVADLADIAKHLQPLPQRGRLDDLMTLRRTDPTRAELHLCSRAEYEQNLSALVRYKTPLQWTAAGTLLTGAGTLLTLLLS